MTLALDPDEHLPWPDAAKLSAWWDKKKSGFARNTRHLVGKPVGTDWAKEVLRTGRQRQRPLRPWNWRSSHRGNR